MKRTELLTTLRGMLAQEFNHAQLLMFCYDQAAFHAVYAGLTEPVTFAELTQRLLDYADDEILLSPLLAALEQTIRQRERPAVTTDNHVTTTFHQEGQQVGKQINIGEMRGGSIQM